MDSSDFHDAALVVVGHGSTVNADSCTPVYLHVSSLRDKRLFERVEAAFWKQEPRIDLVVAALTCPRVFVAPLFISEGYFSEQVIPRALGLTSGERVREESGRKLIYCRPVGTHPGMTGVLLARARGVVQQFPFPREPLPRDTTLFIAGHGTGEDENSRVAVERQAGLIREMGIYAGVHSVFMEEEPTISRCSELAQTRNIVVVPFFISDGLHVREDIPVLLGDPERLVRERLASGRATWRNPTEKRGKLVWYSASIGSEPLLQEVVLERVREASAWATQPVRARAAGS